ncbi:MAG: sensor histidine kinase [Acidimicrobiales bacterium]
MALVSIALLAVVTLRVTDADLVSAGSERERATTNVIVATLQSTYQAGGGWHPSTLSAIGDLASSAGFGLTVVAGGRQLLDVATSQTEGRSMTFRLHSNGQQVGTATVQFPTSGLSREEAALRRSIATAVATASVLAALLAFVAAVIASRRLVAPVRLLTAAARRLGSGDLNSRVGEVVAPGEIVELAHSFDSMATHLQREDTLRRTIVADLAHELRTPLAVLQAELEALTVGVMELSPSAIISLSDEVGRLSRLVEDLEVLAAAVAAGLSLRREPVDLAEIARTIVTRMSQRFQDCQLELTTELMPTVVVVDPGRVEQMVTNLLSNSVKFTPPGGTVRLTVDHDATTAHVVVADSGIGIPKEEQGLVFGRFFRGKGTRGTAGSGVGLAVVAELANAHGGSVSLQSAAGAGTTMTISLPRL